MSEPRLSVIVPTIGRPSLDQALASVRSQAGGDQVELLVVADASGYHPAHLQAIEDTAAEYDARYFEHGAGFSAWGHPQRNFAMPQATGAYLAFLDDDDIWTPDAYEQIQRALDMGEASTRLHIFRMRYPDGAVLWARPQVAPGNVGTPMLVVANDPAMLGRWGNRYEGDFDFLTSTLARCEAGRGALQWWARVICLIRPGAA